jgi:hypothetical protein
MFVLYPLLQTPICYVQFVRDALLIWVQPQIDQLHSPWRVIQFMG